MHAIMHDGDNVAILVIISLLLSRFYVDFDYFGTKIVASDETINLCLSQTQWMATPQFGGWDQKSRVQNYSMVFSRARAKRKECKSHVKGASFDNEHELIIPSYQRQKEISHKVQFPYGIVFFSGICNCSWDLEINCN